MDLGLLVDGSSKLFWWKVLEHFSFVVCELKRLRLRLSWLRLFSLNISLSLYLILLNVLCVVFSKNIDSSSFLSYDLLLGIGFLLSKWGWCPFLTPSQYVLGYFFLLLVSTSGEKGCPWDSLKQARRKGA